MVFLAGKALLPPSRASGTKRKGPLLNAFIYKTETDFFSPSVLVLIYAVVSGALLEPYQVTQSLEEHLTLQLLGTTVT